MSTPNHPKTEDEPGIQGGPSRQEASRRGSGGEPVTLGERASQETIKARHDEISRNIRAVSLALISYALFCFLTLGQSDDIIFRETGQLQIPFSGGIDISFRGFFLVGPLILIVLTFYLHIFIHELHKCELAASEKLPYVFNLDNAFAKGLTFFIFYFLTPIVFLSFIWSIRASHDVTLWSLVALSVSLVLVWLFRRATPASRGNLKNQPFPLMILVGVFIVSAVPGNMVFFGPIEIAKSDLKNTSFKHYVLDRLNADSANLEHADFSGNQYVKEALFNNAALMNTNFSGANLDKSRFRKSNLSKAVLRGASLKGADFEEARLIDTDLSPLSVFKIEESVWPLFRDFMKTPGPSPTGPARPKATRLSLNPIGIPQATRDGAEDDARPAPDPSSTQPKNAPSKTPVNYNTRLDGARFDRAVLLKSKLTSAVLDKARFIEAELNACLLEKVRMIGGDFTGAKIRESIFEDANLKSSQFIRTVIQNSRFTSAQLAETLFQGATLVDVNFNGADLSQSNFYDTVFDKVDFTGAKLEKSDLSNHTFYNVRFDNTNLKHAVLDLANMADNTILNTDFTRATLSGASFHNSNLTGSRFTEADLDSTDFSGANLKFADFRGAQNLRGPRGRLNPSLKQAQNFRKALFDNDIRKELGVDEKTLRRTIALFVDHHYPQYEKDRALEDLKAYYGLTPKPELILAPLSRSPDAQSHPLMRRPSALSQ